MKNLKNMPRNLQDLEVNQNQNQNDLLVRRMESSEADRLKIKFWNGINKNNINGCWDWINARDGKGYGIIRHSKNKIRFQVFAHRYSMIVHGHIIPKGMVVDHKCRNHKCVNPSHLRIVNTRTNCLENSNGASANNLKKTHCIHGHEFSLKNTYYYTNRHGNTARACKACGNINHNKRNKALRELLKEQGNYL